MKLMKKRKKKKKKYGQEHKIYLENKGNCSWKGVFYLGIKFTWNEGGICDCMWRIEIIRIMICILRR